MDFRSLNKFNVIVNTASGNFLPLTGENTGLSLPAAVYLIFIWFIDITYFTATLIGLLYYLPTLEAVRTGGVWFTICAEVLFLAAYLIYRRKYLRNFICKINSILVDSDDLRRCINDTIEPHKRRLKLYTVMNMSSWLVWEIQPLAKLLETEQFTYIDFKLATYFPGGPFTVNGFVFGVLFRAVGGCCIMIKKIGIDVYINYFITLLTAEYRYLEERMAAALREKDEILVIDALKECVQYHCNAIEIGHMLIDLLSVNIGLTYVNCICRFCCLGFTFMTSMPGDYVEKSIILLFGAGFLVQVYMLCLCVQELLEASTSIYDDAFYENWYGRGGTVRSIFRTIGQGNLIECRLTAFRIIDLTVPTYASILRQAYSACLLLLRIK